MEGKVKTIFTIGHSTHPAGGFITLLKAFSISVLADVITQESVFIHVNQLSEPIKEHDKVTFEVEMGPRGASATNVKKTS